MPLAELMLRRRIVDANKGRSAVPVLRYFVVMGCCLLGLLFSIDYLVPREAAAPKAEATPVSNGGTLASWRQSQERHDKSQAEGAVVYPTMAPLPPTAERLQWERQLTFRKPDSASPALQARAELPATAAEAITAPASAAEAIAPPAPSPKSVARVPSRHKTVARAERHDRPNYAAAYPPAPISRFSGYRQAQYDRPGGGGGFFGFRMF
jgi:hypothetical protein